MKRFLAVLKSAPHEVLAEGLPALNDYIRLHPDDDIARNARIMVLRKIGRMQEATALAEESIHHFTGKSLVGLAAEIARNLGPDVRIEDLQLTSHSLQGSEHVGFFTHQLRTEEESKPAITKIVLGRHIGREAAFYAAVKDLQTPFSRSIPRVYDILYIPEKDCYCITMEKIEGSVINLEKMTDEDIGSLLLSYSPLSQLELDASSFRPAPLELKLGLKRLSIAMAYSHSRTHFESFIQWLLQVIHQRNYHPTLVAEIDSVFSKLIESNISSSIVPTKQFGLNHGDCYHNNILSTTNGSYMFLDWSNAVVTAKSVDMAQLLRRLPYPRTKRLLEANGIVKTYDEIDWALFNFALVAGSVMIDIPQIISEDPEKMFFPALNELRRAL